MDDIIFEDWSLWKFDSLMGDDMLVEGSDIEIDNNFSPIDIDFMYINLLSYATNYTDDNDINNIDNDIDSDDINSSNNSTLTNNSISIPIYKYQCNMCDDVFAYKNVLIKHRRDHSPKIYKYKCKHCSLRFASIGQKNSHKKSVHSNTRFICDICDNSLSTKGNLTFHYKKKHPEHS